MSSATWRHGTKVRLHIEQQIAALIRAAGLQPGQKVTVFAEDYDAIARINFNGVKVVRGQPRTRRL